MYTSIFLNINIYFKVMVLQETSLKMGEQGTPRLHFSINIAKNLSKIFRITFCITLGSSLKKKNGNDGKD